MPKENRRAAPRRTRTSRRISLSFPMYPSVSKATIRRRCGSAVRSSAARIPEIISVPPSPWSESRYSSARRTFSRVGGRGSGASPEADSEKRMIWKVSAGRRASRALRTTFFAAASGTPRIEPEQSRTKTSSRGAAASLTVAPADAVPPTGGSMRSVKTPGSSGF